MPNFERDPTQAALDELLSAAGIEDGDSIEQIITSKIAENVANGPGRYRVPGVIERQGRRVIVGDFNTHIVPVPDEPQTLEEARQDAMRMRKLYGVSEE